MIWPVATVRCGDDGTLAQEAMLPRGRYEVVGFWKPAPKAGRGFQLLDNCTLETDFAR
jgi:hypothetical protein